LNRFLQLLVLFSIFLSCTPDQEKFTFDQSAQLRFSADTILFDTVFTTLGSVTKRLKIYNDSENALNISQISLTNGSASSYSIYVNGLAGPNLENIRILGKDSILVLAEVTIDPQNVDLPFIVTDQINLSTNGNQQKIQLVSWGQDANFLRDSILTCNTTWTADRPYVIYNSILIGEGCTLNVEKGTKVYSHNGSYIFVRGSIQAVGTAEDRITFSNDRFDGVFKDAPGQWGGFIFLEGSDKNIIDYADIRNANVGIYLGTPDDNSDPDLILSNSKIENIGGNDIIPTIDSLVQPGYGIIAFTSDLYAYNVLINNCLVNSVANLVGGNYRYEHCTIGGYSNGFFRNEPSLVISDNILLGDNSLLIADLNFQMTNSIVWGNMSEEFLLSNSEQTTWNVSFERNIIRSSDPFFESTDNELSLDPKFFDPFDHIYELDTLSPAKDTGLDIGILTDLNGVARDSKPDLGAFERIE
jgi:hypothetical protein